MRGKPAKLKGRANRTDADVGRRLRARRKMLDVSQRELGKAGGVSYQQIQKYENGTDRVGVGRLQRFAEHLDVPVTYFFGELALKTGHKRARIIDQHMQEFLELPEALKIIRLLPKIKDRSVRRRVVKLVELLAK